MSNQQPSGRPKESWEELVPYTLTFGVVHMELGFDTIDRTTKFLQFLLGEKLIGYQLLEEKNMDQDNQDVMRTQEIPKDFRKKTKKRAKPTAEEMAKLGYMESMEAFLNIRGRLRFNSQEIIAFIPLAQAIKKEKITVEEYMAREAKRLALMREDARKRGFISELIRSKIFYVLLIGAGAAAWHFYPEYKDRLGEWKERVFTTTETAPVNSKSNVTPLTTSEPISETPSAATELPLPESEPASVTADQKELERKSAIRQLRIKAEQVLNPYQSNLEQCETGLRQWTAQPDGPQRQSNLEQWGEIKSMLMLLEGIMQLLARIDAGEQVTDMEIDSVLNPNNYTEETLTTIQQNWEKPEVVNHPLRKRTLDRVHTHLELLRMSQELKKMVRR